jgi:hypothetical protein
MTFPHKEVSSDLININKNVATKIGNIGEQFVKLYYFIKGYEVGDGQPGGFFDIWYADKKTGTIKCVQVKTSRCCNRTKGLIRPYYGFCLFSHKNKDSDLKISICDHVLVAISKDGNVRLIFYSHELIIKMDCKNIELKANEINQIKPDFEISQELATKIYNLDFDGDFEDTEIDLNPSQGLLFCMEKQ